MIRSIRLRNFQIWEDLLVTLDPLVTTIIGPNGGGKTAILRALYWLCFGRPLGNDFIRSTASDCRVTIHAGRTIHRSTTTSGKSAYRIGGKIPKLFVAFGPTVPEAVQGILNVSAINFQRQLDPPFWMLDSPGQVARNLNCIVNLDDIDTALASASSKVRSAKSVVQVTEGRIKGLEDKVESLSWVSEFRDDVAELTALQEKLENAQEARQGLRLLVSRGKVASRARRRLVGACRSASRVSSTARTLLKAGTELNELRRLVDSAQAARAKTEQMSQQLKSLKEKSGDVCPTCGSPLKLSSAPTCISPTSHRSPGKKKGRSGME